MSKVAIDVYGLESDRMVRLFFVQLSHINLGIQHGESKRKTVSSFNSWIIIKYNDTEISIVPYLSNNLQEIEGKNDWKILSRDLPEGDRKKRYFKVEAKKRIITLNNHYQSDKYYLGRVLSQAVKQLLDEIVKSVVD
jgi:hypothetical protein